MNQNNPPMDPFSVQQAMKLAQSDAGKQLFALLQQSDSGQLENAMNQASSGNFIQAKNTLSAMLASPEAQELLKKLGGSENG